MSLDFQFVDSSHVVLLQVFSLLDTVYLLFTGATCDVNIYVKYTLFNERLVVCSQVYMSTVESLSTPNQKNTRSKNLSSPVTEHSKMVHSSGKRAVGCSREIDFPEHMDDDVPFGYVDVSQKNGILQEDDEEVSDAPLAGQNTLLRLGYTHPKLDPDNKTGIRVELIIQEKLKHIGFNELKAFLNEMGKNYFQPANGNSPVLCREINGYPVPKSDKICMFGKILCKPDLVFLKKLFIKAAEQSNMVLCPETFSSDEKSLEIASPYFIRGVLCITSIYAVTCV